MKRIIVIGAGASGMMAAIAAARQGAAVTVLEGMEKPGKKLLITGNGRCNLTNLYQGTDCYRGADDSFICGVLEQFPAKKTLAFFREIGLLTCEKNGSVYPVSGQASAVLDVLLLELSRLGVKVKCREKVRAIAKENGVFQVQTDSWTYGADALILCAGSRAAAQTGSDGSGYTLAETCGHTVLPVLPALVPLIVSEKWVRKLSGLRMPASLTLYTETAADGKRNYQERGELQWTDYGVSGIAVFQLSRHAVRAVKEGGSARLHLDLLPDTTEEELTEHLRRRAGCCGAADLLTGILARKAAAVFLSLADISAEERAKRPDDRKIRALSRILKALPLTVTGARPFEQAQVCQGGVNSREVHAGTLESKLLPGFYLAGEVLDVDGTCGGYNLQWAWSSGYVAGTHAAI